MLVLCHITHICSVHIPKVYCGFKFIKRPNTEQVYLSTNLLITPRINVFLCIILIFLYICIYIVCFEEKTYIALYNAVMILHVAVYNFLSLLWYISVPHYKGKGTFNFVKILPGLNLSPQVKNPPWTHPIPLPHLSLTTTVSFTGLKCSVIYLSLRIP